MYDKFQSLDRLRSNSFDDYLNNDVAGHKNNYPTNGREDQTSKSTHYLRTINNTPIDIDK